MNPKSKLDENTEDYSERYIRWQGRRIEQMGFLNNLLIGLASGSLVWIGNYLLFNSNNENIYFLLSTLFFAVSLVLGFFAAWNRLNDFRLTAQVLRSLIEEPPSTASKDKKSQRKQMRADAKNLGESPWNLLRWQIISFAVGLASTATAVAYYVTSSKWQ